FGCYLVLGICLILTLQALINMAVAVDLFPVTGQPLPLLSMGGTSLWFTALGIGIVLSVSVAVENQGKGRNIDESTVNS
ncbi:MAG: FtsW/RodA/SpoVE family cell cycle protein, partial [Bacteroidales bacterium]